MMIIQWATEGDGNLTALAGTGKPLLERWRGGPYECRRGGRLVVRADR
jgi:hypothetical protein